MGIACYRAENIYNIVNIENQTQTIHHMLRDIHEIIHLSKWTFLY